MKKIYSAFIVTIFLLFVLFFPQNNIMAYDYEKYNELVLSYIEKNNRIHLALGERVLDKKFDQVFNAMIIGLPDVGLTVKNMEKSSGYIFSEGKLTMPMDEYMKLVNDQFQEIREYSGRKFTFETYEFLDVKVSIYLFRINDRQTKVKARIICDRSGIIYPPWLERAYNGIWRSVERQVFLDENLDGNDNKQPAAVNKREKGISRMR